MNERFPIDLILREYFDHFEELGEKLGEAQYDS